MGKLEKETTMPQPETTGRVYLDRALLDRIAALLAPGAAHDGRSVRWWVERLVERELDAGDKLAAAVKERELEKERTP